MATRKKKISSPLSWAHKLRLKLTSRLACFVWGALFGNAVLQQPINPFNLVMGPPEQMLSDSSRLWLEQLRQGLRQFGAELTGGAIDTVREQASGLVPTSSLTTPRPGPLPSGGSTAAPHPQPATGSPDFAACADQFPGQAPLHISAVSTQWAPLALCSDAFAVLYSGLTKTPLLTVEKLSRQRLQHAAGQPRTDHFYADARLPSALRATLTDYQGSGFDRGHLAAAANQPSPQAMAQSFALSNMVPQDPTHNRKLWSKLEADVRKYAQRAAGNVYVFTGALHEGTPHRLGPSQVWVPSHLFKLVYDQAGQRAWAYVLPNRGDAQITAPMDYAQFVQRTRWQLLAGQPVVGSIR